MIQYPSHGKAQSTLDPSYRNSIRLPDLISLPTNEQSSDTNNNNNNKRHLYGNTAGQNAGAVSRMSEHHISLLNIAYNPQKSGHQIKTKSSFDSRGLVQPTFQPIFQEQKLL